MRHFGGDRTEGQSGGSCPGRRLRWRWRKGIPTACVVASRDAAVVGTAQNLLHQPTFRVYTSLDIFGVELGGSLKNVIAVAAGVCDGLGIWGQHQGGVDYAGDGGDSAIGSFLWSAGGYFCGVEWLGRFDGDLFFQIEPESWFWRAVGQGRKACRTSCGSMVAVAEGYPTARSAYQLARKHNVMTPVIDEVYQMLYEGKDVKQGVQGFVGEG